MPPPPESGSPLPPEINSHYAAGMEAGRLARGSGRLELVRTQEILRRYLPPPPAVVADVRRMEADPSLLGVSAHLLAVARK